MRQRLLVGVLTSKSTLGTLAVAVNRTLAHRLERLVYFTGTRGRKVPHGMTVVTHGDERPIWNMYQTVRYLLEHYVNDFDWFFLVQDDTYTEAHRINRLVAHLSIDTLLYLGRPEEFIGGDTDGRYCYGGFGFLLSRSLLLRLQPHLESCRNDILSSRPDEWLGRCIIDHTAVSCTEEHEVGPVTELGSESLIAACSAWHGLPLSLSLLSRSRAPWQRLPGAACSPWAPRAMGPAFVCCFIWGLPCLLVAGWGCGSGLAVTSLPVLTQGLLYQYFELGKNVNPEHETDLRFQSAFTVHPVLDPVQMYRLHKYFAQVELERTYLEIEQLQVRWGLAARIWALPAITF